MLCGVKGMLWAGRFFFLVLLKVLACWIEQGLKITVRVRKKEIRRVRNRNRGVDSGCH